MNLSELAAKEVDFTAAGIELTFRPFTIADDMKSKEICGSRISLVKAFEEFDFEKITLIAWFQLNIESQRKIVEVVAGVTLDPESGKETPVNLKPIEKFRNLFLGTGDQISLLTNLLNCRGLNIPPLDDEKALGEWVAQATAALPSIGKQYST